MRTMGTVLPPRVRDRVAGRAAAPTEPVPGQHVRARSLRPLTVTVNPRSWFDPHTFTVNGLRPPVDPAPVVSDLEAALGVFGLYQVKVLRARNATEDDVA